MKPSHLPSSRHGPGEPSGPERSSLWLPKGCHLPVVCPGGVDERVAKLAWALLKWHRGGWSPGSTSPWYQHWARALLDPAEVGLVL